MSLVSSVNVFSNLRAIFLHLWMQRCHCQVSRNKPVCSFLEQILKGGEESTGRFEDQAQSIGHWHQESRVLQTMVHGLDWFV